ncbi:MAG: phage tail tube protein [Desulfosporosinus sp.]|nr:phage tail tube protein [Desulfosporosinus sp.]
MANLANGIGAILQVGATTIGTITKITSPQLKRNAIDVTTLSSPGGFKQFLAGIADPGKIVAEGFFNTADSGQNLLYNKFVNGTVDTYTLTFPSITGASWTASAFIEELDLATNVDMTKALDFKLSLQINGQPSIGTSPTSGLSGMTFTGTAGTLSPTFANGVYAYAYTFTTNTTITVTPTAGVQQQYTMYVDGMNQGTFNTGSVSPTIPYASVGSHKIDLVVAGSGLTPLTYSIIAVRIS